MLPQFFTESMLGAPAGNGASPGNLIAILDACLVNGFNSQSALALTRAGQLVTVNKTGHGYLDWQLVTIAGATQTEYNGVFRIRRVDANNFTYTLGAGLTPTTPATGSITGLTTPLGWAKAFSATNKGAYRAPIGARHYLRIDATNTSTDGTLWVEAFTAMTSITAGTNPYPTTARGGANVAGDRARFVKPQTRTAGDAGWIIVGDDRRVIILSTTLNTVYRALLMFGDFKSYLPSDARNVLYAGFKFPGGANLDNAGDFYTQGVAFPYAQLPGVPTDGGNFSTQVYQAVLASNPSTSTVSVPCGFLAYGQITGRGSGETLGPTYGEPYTSNDVILGHPLITEQPLSASSSLALRGKLQQILYTGYNVDYITLGGVDKLFVSPNVPLYGQVLNVGWTFSGTGISSQAGWCFPLCDWEIL